jgi:ketosteroid isomerase-like protein
MIAREWAEAFARDWIAAWNAHDLERILSHYADDFEMRSPLIVERMGVPEGLLKGKEAIRPYWQAGLAAKPPLKFELREVMVGVGAIAIVYRNVTRGADVVERIEFNEQGLGVRAEALYGKAP